MHASVRHRVRCTCCQCLYACVRACAYACVCVCRGAYVCVCGCNGVCVCMHVPVFVCVCKGVCVCVSAYEASDGRGLGFNCRQLARVQVRQPLCQRVVLLHRHMHTNP
jgi:hypothetical protein